MKKFFFLIILVVSCISAYAIRTTITSSLYGTQNSTSPTSQIPTTWPSTIKKVFFSCSTDSVPNIELALTEAEIIFSNAMKAEYIDLVNIHAEVMFGEASEFSSPGEICKVEIEYTDTIVDNSRYHDISQYMNQDMAILIPLAMSNQSRGYSYGNAMRIKLNPTVSYHYNTTAPESNEYDLVTVLLRALAMGCGIQSTLDPVNVCFGKTIDGITYVNAFDTQIYNDDDSTYIRAALKDQTAQILFLANHNIFVDGFSDIHGSNEVTIQLFNGWSTGAMGFDIDPLSLNTIDGYYTYTDDDYLDNPDFIDLLDLEVQKGLAIRNITPYTMALLRKLGWLKTTPVGPDPLADLYNCSLQCNATTLQPNTSYSLSLSNNSINLNDFVCELFTRDSAYAVGNPVVPVQVFSYSSIPANVQWKRNPFTKNIIGRFRGTASQGTAQLEKICTIEIPYKPNKPIIRKAETTTNGYLQLDLKAFANGSNTYTVTYTGVTNSDTHSFTVTANTLDTLLANIPATQLYNMSIYGTNSQGNSDSYNFTFGFSAHPTLNMSVWVNGNTLTYDLSNNGTIDISDVVISSVQIADPNGYVWLTPNAGSGDPINISSLARGYYIITVVADGENYSRMFIKRR